MTLDAELARLTADLPADLRRFVPELLLCGGIVGGLFAKLFRGFARVHLVPAAVVLVAVAFGFAAADPFDADAFRGLLKLDRFAQFFRGFLLVSAGLVLTLCWLTGLPDAADSADFVTLLLGGTLGMMLMTSANHLLMVFVAIEMASLPGYVLAGFLKGKSRSSEAALKYVVYGAAASGVMLYGISLLCGRFGTGSLPLIAGAVAHAVREGTADVTLAVAAFFVLFGLGFKLAAFPFQFWLPDVFTGAAAEVGAVLAVASKAAAVGLSLRLVLTLFAEGAETISAVLAVAAAVTATLGNVAALAQTNLKRLLAYSTVAHAGYLLMGVACAKPFAAAAVLFYLVGYLPMTLGAFAVVAVVRNRTGSEDLDAIRGLLKRSPALGVCVAVFLFGLLGLPPLAGFAGKFQVFAAVYRTGTEYAAAGSPRLGSLFFAVLAVGVVNTVVSAGYYLKVLKTAGLDDPETPTPLGEGVGVRLYLLLLAAAILAAGILWDPINELAGRAVAGL